MSRNPTVTEIVADWLAAHGYAGLYHDDEPDGCGCRLGDLAPCGEIGEECRAGYEVGDGIGPVLEKGEGGQEMSERITYDRDGNRFVRRDYPSWAERMRQWMVAVAGAHQITDKLVRKNGFEMRTWDLDIRIIRQKAEALDAEWREACGVGDDE